MSGRLKAESGGGNVFSDLGFPEAEAENLLLRSQLMSEIRDITQGLTQAQAAKRLGVSQPRVNDLPARKDRQILLGCVGHHAEQGGNARRDAHPKGRLTR